MFQTVYYEIIGGKCKHATAKIAPDRGATEAGSGKARATVPSKYDSRHDERAFPTPATGGARGQGAAGHRSRRARLADARGASRCKPLLHRGRPRGARDRRRAARLRAVRPRRRGRRCTRTGRGRSASTRASRPPRSRTRSTARTSRPGRWACRSRSTSRRTAATTATTRASSATSARPASRSTPSRT